MKDHVQQQCASLQAPVPVPAAAAAAARFARAPGSERRPWIGRYLENVRTKALRSIIFNILLGVCVDRSAILRGGIGDRSIGGGESIRYRVW